MARFFLVRRNSKAEGIAGLNRNDLQRFHWLEYGVDLRESVSIPNEKKHFL
jgi:hypothetical protein